MWFRATAAPFGLWLMCAIVGQKFQIGVWAMGCCGASFTAVVWPVGRQCSDASVFGASSVAGASAGSWPGMFAAWALWRRFLGNGSCHRDVGLRLCGRASAALSSRALLPPACPKHPWLELFSPATPAPSCFCASEGKGEEKRSISLSLQSPEAYLQGFQFSALHLQCLCNATCSLLSLFFVAAHL